MTWNQARKWSKVAIMLTSARLLHSSMACRREEEMRLCVMKQSKQVRQSGHQGDQPGAAALQGLQEDM
jgi:hypothetical protein